MFQLAGAAFVTGDTDDRATYGLSLKSMTLNFAQYIIADSAGLHRPVASISPSLSLSAFTYFTLIT